VGHGFSSLALLGSGLLVGGLAGRVGVRRLGVGLLGGRLLGRRLLRRGGLLVLRLDLGLGQLVRLGGVHRNQVRVGLRLVLGDHGLRVVLLGGNLGLDDLGDLLGAGLDVTVDTAVYLFDLLGGRLGRARRLEQLALPLGERLDRS